MARTSLTAALTSFVTGAPPTPAKQHRRTKMEDSLRGSARVDTLGSRESGSGGGASSSSVSRGWQQEAWARYDEVGEVRYAAGFVGACLSRCTLTVGMPDSKGNIGPVFDEDGDPLKDEDGNVLPGLERAKEALELVRMLRNDVAGQSQLLRSMGENLTVAGELHLVGSAPGGSDATPAPAVGEIQQWEVLSTDEFRPKGEDYERVPGPGVPGQEIKGENVHVVRIWRSHPRFSELPDSSMRAVLDILEELVLLTREVRGETLSRLSNGKVLMVPDEIEWPDDEAEDGSSEAGDAFTRDLIRTMSTAVSDKGSAAVMVPFIIRAPKDLLAGISTLDLGRTNPSDSSAKRTEAVQRFAQGIDLPVEIVTGHSGTTFANAVVIDDSTYKVHVEPILEIICDALTAGYLRPAMDQPGMEPTPLVVFYDSTELVSRPNRAADAKDLHDRYAISDATLRTSSGFSESDKPDEDEVLQRIKRKQLANVRQTVPATPSELVGEDEGAAGDGDLTPPGTPQAPGAPVEQGTDTAASGDGVLAASVHAAAQVSVERAVRRAGARLRSKSAKTMATRDLLSQVPDAEVAATLGPERLAQVSGNEDLIRGEFDALHAWVCRATGDGSFADEVREACQAITTRRLFAPRADFPVDELPLYRRG